jgi:hypothetical protein
VIKCQDDAIIIKDAPEVIVPEVIIIEDAPEVIEVLADEVDAIAIG